VLSLKGVQLDEALVVPGRFVIGRTTDNDLPIDSKFVSRHHAQLITTPDGSFVEDLNSTNGVFLNGKRVRRHKLAAGDVIRIGQHDLTYSRYEAPAHPAEDPRATQTTVLRESDYESDADADAESEPDEDEERNDGDGDESYSSIARGS
jgi:pSer/pThr/pTyr-binding forkhead associated (FHA) protein